MSIKSTIWFAHRGALLHAPENTLSSFEAAIAMGLPAIEIDVLSTKDGVVVSSHNFDIERKTDGFGYIHEITYKDLAATNVLGPENTKEKICTLKDALNVVGEKVLVNIEIKTRRLFDLSTAFRVSSLLKKTNRTTNTIVSSFNPLLLLLFKCLNKKVKTGWIIQYRELFPFLFLSCADMVHPRGDILSSRLLERFKKRKINVWTINTKPAIEWLEQQGVDGIITDRLEFYK